VGRKIEERNHHRSGGDMVQNQLHRLLDLTDPYICHRGLVENSFCSPAEEELDPKRHCIHHFGVCGSTEELQAILTSDAQLEGWRFATITELLLLYIAGSFPGFEGLLAAANTSGVVRHPDANTRTLVCAQPAVHFAPTWHNSLYYHETNKGRWPQWARFLLVPE